LTEGYNFKGKGQMTEERTGHTQRTDTTTEEAKVTENLRKVENSPSPLLGRVFLFP